MNAEEFAARIIGRRYWFAAGDDAQPLYPVCLVAMRSSSGRDWAAYVAGVHVFAVEDDSMAEAVARMGTKLDEATARAMFPDVALHYRK